MSQYDSFFNSKGKAAGCVLIAIKPDPYQNTNLHIYYIGEDTNVGVVAQGINAWVCPIVNSLFMFNKGELAALIERVKRGEKIDIEAPSPARKRLLLDIPAGLTVTGRKETQPAIQELTPRKQLLKRREVTRG